MFIANHKKLLEINLVLLLIFIAGCAIFPPPKDKALLLEENIRKFNNFRLSGIAEINYHNLVLRKEIMISKDSSKLSAIMVDGGIMGMQATPFASLEIAEKTSFSFAGKKDTAAFSYSQLKKLTSNDFIDQHSREIISKQNIIVDNYQLIWNEQMQLIEISGNNLKVELNYDISGNLTEINLAFKNEIEAKITVDEIKYINIRS